MPYAPCAGSPVSVLSVADTTGVNPGNLTAAFTTGIANNPAIPISPTAISASTFCCSGSFSFLISGNVSRPEPANSTTGNAKFTGISSHFTLANGRSHPPTQCVRVHSASSVMLNRALIMEIINVPMTMLTRMMVAGPIAPISRSRLSPSLCS